VVLDIGTGDGRAVLARAAAEPRSLVIGLDASSAAMAEASRRADRAGLDGVLFLAAGVESLPVSLLAGSADLVTVTFPWGSLLRGILGLDQAALCGVASALAQGGRLEVLASVEPSDGLAGMSALRTGAEPAIRAAWAAAGLQLTAFEEASDTAIAASGSSWARRLRGRGRTPADRRSREVRRRVWRLTGRRPC
jgi:16S rRNA (adenine(1408)-N(1))-methyltransferase